MMNPVDRFQPQDELPAKLLSRFFIDGRWVLPASAEKFDLVSPVTEATWLRVPAGSVADMQAAVDAARRSFDQGAWRETPYAQRAAVLARIAESMRRVTPTFERLWTAQVGAPVGFAQAFTGLGAGQFDFYAGLAGDEHFEDLRPNRQGQPVKVLKEPVGVCALIVPWNAPMLLLVQKLAPALLAGCSVVIKPSPETPLDALLLAHCAEDAGLPPGVLNVVPAGAEVGDALVRNPQVDKVSFTGSGGAGRHIAQVCAQRLARVGLELGGKSATILCEDADVSAWLTAMAPLTMPFSGQICFSQTRVLVPRSLHAEFLEAYVGVVRGLSVGDPWEATTHMGPLSMARQRDRVLGYIDGARREGARLVTGGGAVPGIDRGYFVEPTVFDAVTPDMTIAREEVFGPVVSVMTYENEDDAVRIANATDYGLSGSVFSRDLERAERLARRLRTGTVGLNGLRVDPQAPFGGYKQSGLGRENGLEGLAAFQETKSIYL